MACTKKLTLPEAATDAWPLTSAVYVSTTDRIYGMMGPYVVKINPSTGKPEQYARVCSKTSYGPCYIDYNYANDTLYVSVWNCPNRPWYEKNNAKDIYPVNPTTMAVGSGLGLVNSPLPNGAGNGGGSYGASEGPRFIKYIGGPGTQFIYFVWHYNHDWMINRVDVANPNVGRWITTNAYDASCIWQFGYGGGYIWYGSTDDTRLYGRVWNNFASRVYCDLDPGDYNVITGIAAEYSTINSKPYYVSGNRWLTVVDDFDFNLYTKHDLGANTDPIHLRYHDARSKLFIPSPGTNEVILFDPAGGPTLRQDGFDSPIDIVITPTETWAVQLGAVGLRKVSM